MEISIRNAEKNYDVIVAGGGPSGVTAAVAAARMGAKTLVIEAGGALGGMATLGLVSKWMPFSDRINMIYRSLAKEVIVRYKARVGIPEDKWRGLPIHPEELKRLYDEMAEEAGVEVLFFSTVCGVQKQGDRIESVLVANKSGITAYSAKSFVDCTGDGDLANFAGVEMEYGDKEHYVQEASLCFCISNVHTDKRTRPIQTGREGSVWYQVLEEGKYAPLVGDHFVPTYFGNTMVVNAGCMANVNATDPMEVSRAMILGRKIADAYLRALKEYEPEMFCDAMLVATAPLLGVRESRRIVGQYVLTAKDYFDRRSFPDEICRNSYWLDCHLPADKIDPNGIGLGTNDCCPYEPGESHGIPFRCLVPKTVENLLVAGRCLSVDNVVLSSVRVMPNCLAEGEAAGIGAALCAKSGQAVQTLDAQKVIARIAECDAG